MKHRSPIEIKECINGYIVLPSVIGIRDEKLAAAQVYTTLGALITFLDDHFDPSRRPTDGAKI